MAKKRKPKPCDEVKLATVYEPPVVCTDYHITKGYYEWSMYTSSGPEGWMVSRYQRFEDSTHNTTELAKFKNRDDACWYLRRCRGEA